MIRVLIADDQGLLVGALSALLNLEKDIEVVATCRTGDGVVDAVREHNVDVALLDIEMPGRTGLELAADLAGSPCKVVIVTTFGRPGYLRTALEAGAAGFIVKDTPRISSPTQYGALTLACGWSTRRLRKNPCSPHRRH